MFDRMPGDIAQTLWSLVSTFCMAFLGRLMWHVQEVRKARRRFWSLHLLWEVLTAVSMAFVADGIVSYLGITGRPALAAIVTVSYLGPRGLEVVILSSFGRNRDRL